MIYTLICPDCNEESEFIQMMDETERVEECPSCTRELTRKENRSYGADLPDILGETVAGNRQVSYHYMDPTLGYVNGKQDRKDKMEARGLVDYEPNPDLYKHRVEARKIQSQANPAGDRDAVIAIAKERKAAQTKRTRAGIERAFDNAPKLQITE